MAEPLTAKSLEKAMRIVIDHMEDAEVSVLIGVPNARHYSGLTFSQLMGIHEFGGGNVPERAPFRKTLRANQEKYKRGLAKAAEAAIASGTLVKYEQLGATAADDVRLTIKKRLSPALADSTIARKGSDVPLIDTGSLWQSIGHEVKEGK